MAQLRKKASLASHSTAAPPQINFSQSNISTLHKILLHSKNNVMCSERCDLNTNRNNVIVNSNISTPARSPLWHREPADIGIGSTPHTYAALRPHSQTHQLELPAQNLSFPRHGCKQYWNGFRYSYIRWKSLSLGSLQTTYNYICTYLCMSAVHVFHSTVYER